MEIIKPEAIMLGEIHTDYEKAMVAIEAISRTCYKSEDKITPTSAKSFVTKLTTAKPYPHLAMLEHSNFVARCPNPTVDFVLETVATAGKFLNVVIDVEDEFIYVGGNIRAWYEVALENGFPHFTRPFVEVWGEGKLFDNLKMRFGSKNWEVCPHDFIPDALRRYSVRFICDRGVSHELVRHRPTDLDWYSFFEYMPINMNLAQESTRYVNYANCEMQFIEPYWWNDADKETLRQEFIRSFIECEKNYRIALEMGLTPQGARANLINAIKTEVVVSADKAEWQHVKNLRTHISAHPDMVRVMNMVNWKEILG